ncbi:MAG: glycosyltransferase family 39 protein [Acidobacteriia bacterium]|nr:glycosyltransferase family 39 protein [Terriglobia bacterium]
MSFSTTGTRSARVLFILVVLALAVRIAVIPFLIGDQLNPARDHWDFGCEEGRIARSIAAGEGFGSPLFGRTGPTAWTTPLYPYLLAGVFRLFGIYTRASAWTMLIVDALFAALTCIPVYFAARRCFGLAAAFWAGVIWAFHPYSIYLSASFIWGNCLDALLMALLLWYTLVLEDQASLARWIGYGLLWGVAALNNAVVLSTLPFLLGWLAWRRQRLGLAWRFSTLAALLTLVLTVSPWFVRNYTTFGRFIPFRDTFWMVVWQGNTGDTSDLYPDWANPAHNDAELEKYRRLGELAYMREKRAAALDFLRRYPGLFLRTSAKRFVFTWTGFWSFSPAYRAMEPMEIPNIGFCVALTALMLAGMRRAWRLSRQAVIPFALVLLSYPLVYYFTHPGIDYRHPIDPVAAVFIGVLIAGWRGKHAKPGTGSGSAEFASDSAAVRV